MTSARPLTDLLRLGLGPLIWFAHLALLYGAEPILCRPPNPSLTTMLWLGAVATALALTTLAGLALMKHRAHTDEADAMFLSRATLLLLGLSAIGVIWTATPIAVLAICS